MPSAQVITASSFAAEIQDDINRVRNLFQAANARVSNDEAFRKAFAAQATALVPADTTSQHTASSAGHKTQSPHNVQDISEATLCLCNKLVGQYNGVSKAVDAANPSSQFAIGWEEDLGQLRRLLDVGYAITKAKVDAKMAHNTNENEAWQQGKAKTTQQIDEEREAEALLRLVDNEACNVQDEVGRPLAMNEMLRNAEKGAARMTKGLPEELDDS